MMAFSEVISEEEFKSKTISQETKIKLEYYFKNLKLQTTTECVFDLDDAIPTIFSEKKVGVNFLKTSNVIENVDFVKKIIYVVDKTCAIYNIRKINKYYLSKSILLFLILRKNIEFFKVYSTVFSLNEKQTGTSNDNF